jgi:hypothetical protein
MNSNFSNKIDFIRNYIDLHTIDEESKKTIEKFFSTIDLKEKNDRTPNETLLETIITYRMSPAFYNIFSQYFSNDIKKYSTTELFELYAKSTLFSNKQMIEFILNETNFLKEFDFNKLNFHMEIKFLVNQYSYMLVEKKINIEEQTLDFIIDTYHRNFYFISDIVKHDIYNKLILDRLKREINTKKEQKFLNLLVQNNISGTYITKFLKLFENNYDHKFNTKLSAKIAFDVIKTSIIYDKYDAFEALIMHIYKVDKKLIKNIKINHQLTSSKKIFSLLNSIKEKIALEKIIKEDNIKSIKNKIRL